VIFITKNPRFVTRVAAMPFGGIRSVKRHRITEKDLELARKIEEMIMWQPAKEGGALEGIPDGPKFKYVEYD